MHPILKSHHPARHVKSFKYAFSGVLHAVLNESNFRLQIIIVAFFTAAAAYFRISVLEWAVLVLSMGFLLASEVMNTIIEELMDHFFKEYSETARVIKDLAAAFVLLAALTCLAVFLLTVGSKAF